MREPTPEPGGQAEGNPPLGVVVLIKQVPPPEAEENLDPSGRLVRDPDHVEINPWCRRAITAGITLARDLGEPCTVISMGPPSADRALREARAAGADHAILVSDPALAGSDAAATAAVLTHVIRTRGGARAVVCGLESIDGATGVVPAMVAEHVGWPQLGPLVDLTTHVEHDRVRVAGGVQSGADIQHSSVDLPCVITLAERSLTPAKVEWAIASEIDASEHLDLAALQATGLATAHLGSRSWTTVDAVRTCATTRTPRRVDVTDAATEILRLVHTSAPLDSGPGVDDQAHPETATTDASPGSLPDGPVLVLTRGRREAAAALVTAARGLTRGPVHVVTTAEPDPTDDCYGVDSVTVLDHDDPAPVACHVSTEYTTRDCVGVLAPAELWERAVLGRVAVRLDTGLLTDLCSVAPHPLDHSRWCGDKPVGAADTATVSAAAGPQLATVRTGYLRTPPPSPEAPSAKAAGRAEAPPVEHVHLDPDPRTVGGLPAAQSGTDRLDSAEFIIGVGRGVDERLLPALHALADRLDAGLAATRPLTDARLLPHDLQVGITGRTIAPRIYLALGVSGDSRHLGATAHSGTIIAVDSDPTARIHEHCDVSVVGDLERVVDDLLAATAPTADDATVHRGASATPDPVPSPSARTAP